MSVLKVFLDPLYTRPDRGDGGIRRVTEAQQKYLPQFGIEVVTDLGEADLINNHGTAMSVKKNVPIVHSGHGLMWSRYNWGDWAHEVNKQVVAAMKIAQAHTAPSRWVADSLCRGMAVYPEIIYHGIEIADWPVGESEGYILWNKARSDFVSNPADMEKLAELMPQFRFMSTLGQPGRNINLTGKVDYETMKGLVRGAGVYLATARETFGIGTLEALASGVPVVGWDWGGQSEIIIQGETGLLAPPGNFEALAKCASAVLADRERYSKNARQDAEERWTWLPRIEQYANLFRKTVDEWKAPDRKVSVIVTSHNLGRYLGDALNSVRNQSLSDWECIIVDDASTDGTKEVAENFVKQDERFRYFKTPSNLKLSMARNFGVAHSKGRYIIPLDADDMFDDQTLRILADALDADRSIHIVYGHLDIVSEDGSNRRRNPWPFEQFSWRGQMAHLNQLSYCAMMRREVFTRGGGYRERHWRAEDANMWCRLSSFGFALKKVTQRSLLIYRDRGDSKSKGEPGDGDWTAWYPWRLAGSPSEATERRNEISTKNLPDPAIVPFGAQGSPSKGLKFWYAHDFAYPRVSVVIPVGKGHESYVIDAVESVMAQTYPDWELIVVNDTGKSWPDGLQSPVAGAPYARVIETEGGKGAAYSRNLGFRHAKGQAYFPLDADDYILPTCLERMVAHLEQYDGIIYSGWLKNTMDGETMEYMQPKEFECGKIIEKMWHSGSSILISRWLHEKIGGWDEKITGWEDWDYLIAAQHHGACSYRVEEPLFVYRFHSGTQREESWKSQNEILAYITEKWYDYRVGDKKMGCGCKNKKAITAPNSAFSSSGNFVVENAEQSLLLEYQGEHDGPLTLRGEVTGARYRFGKLESYRRKYVRPDDAREFLTRILASGKQEFIVVGVSPEIVKSPPVVAESQVPEIGVPA